MMKSDEVFKIIEDHPTYMVSNKGRVLNTKRNRFLKGDKGYNGYVRVSLCNEGDVTRILVHRLVATAFICNPENLPTVNHKDGVRDNNCLSNLEWMSYPDNVSHAVSKTSNVMSPNGVTYSVTNIAEFCRTHSLNKGHMSAMIRGDKPQHKGWTKC